MIGFVWVKWLSLVCIRAFSAKHTIWCSSTCSPVLGTCHFHLWQVLVLNVVYLIAAPCFLPGGVVAHHRSVWVRVVLYRLQDRLPAGKEAMLVLIRCSEMCEGCWNTVTNHCSARTASSLLLFYNTGCVWDCLLTHNHIIKVWGKECHLFVWIMRIKLKQNKQRTLCSQ